MKEFFKGQFDYIYFFYGLSFLLMAFFCFTLSKDKLRRFPWRMLGLFGLSHGLAEWLDMAAMFSDRGQVIAVINLFLLGISFIFLLEFARAGFLQLKGRMISGWFYLIILPLLFFAYRSGPAKGVIILRYFLGFTSAYAASRIIYEFYKTEASGKWPILTLSLILSLYAVFTGLIVPKSGFLPASLVNFESFFDTFGVPVQLIRAILALCAALCVWFYSSVPPKVEYQPRLYPLRFIPTKWMIALALVLLVAGGWIFTNYLDYYAGIQAIKRNRSQRNSQLNMLIKELTSMEKAAISLSRASAIRNMFSLQEPKNMERANSVLANYTNKFGALNCSVINEEGMPIVSTNEKDTEIKVGKSLFSRSYFRDSMAGKTGYYFKLGPLYNERVYYVSHPIKDGKGRISGAAVIVKTIRAEPLFQYRIFSIVITFFICIIAIMFFNVLKRRELLIEFIERLYSQLQELDDMKTDFLSAVSHELRTPLTSINNAAGILMKGGSGRRLLDKEEKELLNIIMDNVRRQARMVNDLLDVSRIEAHVMPIFPKNVDPGKIVEQAAASLRPLADEKKISLVLDIGTPGKKVYADPEHVARILNNLIANAIDFTYKEGTITVKIEDLGQEIRISVSDTGIGISAADQEILFQKFCRPASSGQERKRCGLGLAITKGLVEAQGGRIWVESELGRGSSFYFTLPKPSSKHGKEEKDPGHRR